jgi:membrane-associated phospholipid phosphatase
MALALMASLTAVVVLVGTVTTGYLCIDREQFRDTTENLDNRVYDVAPYFVITGVFFLLKRFTHEPSVQIQKAIGWEITSILYSIEGLFVARVQDIAPPIAVPVFSAFYMFGFPYLLVVPLVLYLLSSQARALKTLLFAYMLNYVVGQICYTLFVAYGPRVHLAQVDGLMYEAYPMTQDMTGAVAAATDVFPSLHTSLAVVVLLVAWQTRDAHPRWFKITAFVSTGVVLSTMVLGIHWLVDVLAGLVLAVWSVYAARRIVEYTERHSLVRPGFLPEPTTGETSSRSDD